MREDIYLSDDDSEADGEDDTISRRPAGRLYDDYYFLAWDRRQDPSARPSWY